MHHAPFDDLPRTEANHFTLYYFAAVAHIIHQLRSNLEEFPFLEGYQEELTRKNVADLDINGWIYTIASWERTADHHLPLRALQQSLDYRTILLLFCIGLIEEDNRFGAVFESLQPTPVQRPTWGLMTTWWRDADDDNAIRQALKQLRNLMLIEVTNLEVPRPEWTLQPTSVLWDALRGDASETPLPWLLHQPVETLALSHQLILPQNIAQALTRLPMLLETGEVQTLVIRGALHGGRRTLCGSVARALGRGMLQVEGLRVEAEQRIATTLAMILNALPVFVLDPGPGETVQLPKSGKTFAVILGQQGGLSGDCMQRSFSLVLEAPSPQLRRAHWLATLPRIDPIVLSSIAANFRMASGNIQRTARLARSYATLDDRDIVTQTDIQQAARALNKQALETLAVHIEAEGNWSHLAISADTHRDLRDLEARCRYREQLREGVGVALHNQLRPGVRALLQGPSGTGKTLAAKILAAVLQRDLYKVDLANVVNKYIGETEKNLSRLFALAEQLDVVLLLDEGDALLAQRTAVRTSNDRYANLETNYLLQRLESFEGILLLTTNTAENIDAAFQRRMDVVIDFRPPDAAERWVIWQLHLPADHDVDLASLKEIAARCQLTGGQIRNAVLHAAMLAITHLQTPRISSEHLQTAVQREYRKAGAVYPVRRPVVVAVAAGGR
jgi:hypothetical protein